MKKIVIVETGEIIERELNAEEIAQQNQDEIDAAEKLAPFIAEAEAKAAQRQAIADRLGLTAEELKVLLG